VGGIRLDRADGERPSGSLIAHEVLIVVPMVVYNLLIIAFGIGVWLRGWNSPLRVSGALFIAYGVVSMMGLFVFPLDYNAEDAGATMHVVTTFLLILLMFMFIGFAAAGSGRAFRLYSILTVATILAGAILSGMQIPRIDAHLPTPGLGVYERLNIYSMLLWVAGVCGVAPESEVQR
jgi:hypothetical protein